jgi:hypothetical protein
MRDCWNAEPGLRPSFADLAEKMGEELQEGEKDARRMIYFCGMTIC